MHRSARRESVGGHVAAVQIDDDAVGRPGHEIGRLISGTWRKAALDLHPAGAEIEERADGGDVRGGSLGAFDGAWRQRLPVRPAAAVRAALAIIASI